MPITSSQKTAIEEVVHAITTQTATRGKRVLSAMFMELVDRAEWPQYYEVIPEPRCLNNIKSGVEKGRYKDATDVYTDLSLVFWNALFYNEPGSQIALDALTLKTLLETEWKKRSILPVPRTSPPPSSAQKVHKTVDVNQVKSAVPEAAATSSLVQHTSAPAPVAAPVPAIAAPQAVPTHAAVLASQHLSVPTASTSNSSYVKPVPIRPKSAQTTDVDVDIISTGIEAQVVEASGLLERDPESEMIIKQLEKGLPRWPGFSEDGWMEDMSTDRLPEIVHAIKSHKDVIGNRLAVALESMPEDPIKNSSWNLPLSLKLVENRAKSNAYNTAKEFDMELARLFEKARRWHHPGTEAYGRVLLLQRLYQAITFSYPFPGPPYHSSTGFSSLRAGPGSIPTADGEGVSGVTTYRVLTKDRTFVEEVHYKGWTVKLADWLHLSNPDDPSRPIVGQVFRCWVSEEASRKGQQGITVSWYYRPEQTFHSATREFWEGEVFKTGHFADHPLPDIIEKIACQFTARHIRGRPRPPYWYPGWPLYVCDSRYNDKERVFVKIKNWNSCIPEEVRKSTEFMPIYLFERTIFPARMSSPFVIKGLGSVKGPGGIMEASGGGDEGPKRAKKEGVGSGSSVGVGTPAQYTQQNQMAGYSILQPLQRPPGPDRSVITAAGGLAVLGGNGQVEKLPPETTKYFDRDPDTNEVLWFPAPPMNVARPPRPQHSIAYLQFLAKKRKQEENEKRGNEEGDINDPNWAKRSRMDVGPTVTETMKELLRDIPGVVK